MILVVHLALKQWHEAGLGETTSIIFHLKKEIWIIFPKCHQEKDKSKKKVWCWLSFEVLNLKNHKFMQQLSLLPWIHILSQIL